MAKELGGSRKVTSAINEKVIKSIARLTSSNNHIEAIGVLAEAMGERGVLKVTQAVDVIINYAGHLPRGLGEIETGLRNRLLAKAERQLSPEEYQSLYMAF